MGRGHAFDMELRILTGSGRVKWVRCMGEAARDADGRVVGVDGALQDIDHRKRIEDDLRRQLRFKRLVVEASAELVAARDPAAVNRCLDELLRRLVQQLAAARGFLVYDASDEGLPRIRHEFRLDGCPPLLASAAATSVADWRWWHLELAEMGVIRLASTEALPAVADAERDDLSPGPCGPLLAIPLGATDRRISGFFCFQREPGMDLWRDEEVALVQLVAALVAHTLLRHQTLAALKDSSYRLRASEERLRLAAGATADLIYDWDVGADTVWWSEGLKTMFGHDPEQLPDGLEGWTNLVHPEDRSRVETDIACLVTQPSESGSGQWSAEYRFRRADGSYAVVRDSARVLSGNDGSIVRMVGSIADITEMVQLERKLRESQRLEALGQLTGGVAHDFNNLLTVILGNAELIREATTDREPLHTLATMVSDAAGRASELTRSLLAFAGRQALAPEAWDINSLIEGMHSLLARTLGTEIDIRLDLNEDLPPVLIDRSQLENALLNLCLNARDAMPDGGRVLIETEEANFDAGVGGRQPDLEPGGYVVLSVSDTGCGVAPEHLERLFEPFFTTKPKGKGNGLGLAMVHGFVKQSKGHVSVYSELGEGATLRLYLPVAKGSSSRTISERPLPPVTGGSETILLVEDNEMVRRHAEQLLQSLGYRVICADSAAAALALLYKGLAFDLLLTDVIMPGGMNGRELAEEFLRERPGLPVLFTSGYSESVLIDRGRLAAGVDLLPKPYRRADLARRVRRALDRRDSGRSPVRSP